MWYPTDPVRLLFRKRPPLLITVLTLTALVSWPSFAQTSMHTQGSFITAGRPRGPEEATATYRFRCRDKVYVFEFAKKPLRRLELISATPADGPGLDRLRTALAEMGQVDRIDADCSNTQAELRLILTRFPEGSAPSIRTWSPDPQHKPMPIHKDP